MPQHYEQLVYRSATVSVSDIRCRPRGDERAIEERSGAHEVVFTRGGAFVKHVRGSEVLADCNHVMFFNADEPYRVTHPVAGGDDCTVFRFAPHVLSDALGARDPRVRDRPHAPFRHTHAPAEPAELLRQHLLRAASLRGDDLAIDERALELLDVVLNRSYAVRGDGRRARARSREPRDDTTRAHREIAHATQALLNEAFAESMDLARIARRVHSSPYHLARLFRRHTGRSIHEYRNRLRLGAALERIADCGDDRGLTALALDLGYSSHAHFSDTFRRTFGVSPSQFRRSARRTALREMSTMLKA